MESFSISELSRLLAKIYDRACHSPIDQYQYWIIQYLQNYIEFDSATWGIFNFDDRLPRSYILFNISDDFPSCYESFQANDSYVEALAINPGKTLNSIDYDLTSSPGYLGLYEKYKIRHILAIILPDEKMRVHHALSIIRADKDHPFSEDERHFIQATAPHLMQAWRINCQFFLNTFEAHEAFNRPFKMALVDYQGGVQQAIQGFDGLIKREWKGWQDNILPQELIDQLINEREESYTGDHVVITATYFEYLIALQVYERSPIDSLTLREREVAMLSAQGKNYKEIATELNISHSTVRNHLQKIYARLHINNKAQLMKLLFD